MAIIGHTPKVDLDLLGVVQFNTGINRLRYREHDNILEYTKIYRYTVDQVKQILFNKLGFAKSNSQDKVRTLSVCLSVCLSLFHTNP